MTRKPYPSEVSDDDWAFVALYLTLMTEQAPQRQHHLRESFNGRRWLVRAGASWRLLPHDVPPWEAVYPQTQRWLKVGGFDAIVPELRTMRRTAHGQGSQLPAGIVVGRTLQSSGESGSRAGYAGHQRRQGSKVLMVVDTVGHWLALVVTPANEPERVPVAIVAKTVPEVTEPNVEVAFVNLGDPGDRPAEAAPQQGLRREVVKRDEATRGLVRLPRRWVVKRSFAWVARFRRLARDDERWSETLASLYVVVFAMLRLVKAAPLLQSA